MALTDAIAPCICMALAAAGCELPSFPSTPLITVEMAGEGTGFVKSEGADKDWGIGIDCGSLCQTSAFELTLSASDGPCSWFSGWSGVGCGTSRDCHVVTEEDLHIVATFDSYPHWLLVHSEGTGSGTVRSTPAGIDCGPKCSAQFEGRMIVALTATPAAGSRFVGWSGTDPCLANDGTTCELILWRQTSLTATFELEPP